MWGKADDGQLGLGGIEDTFIPVARSGEKHVYSGVFSIQWNSNADILGTTIFVLN